MNLLSTQEVINQIAEVLPEADGGFIEQIANEVLGRKVRYIEDDLFEYVVPNDQAQLIPRIRGEKKKPEVELPDITIPDLPEVDKTVTLSTAHITKEDNKLISQPNVVIYNANPINRDNYTGGTWVYISSDKNEGDYAEMREYGYSHEFAVLYLKMRELGFRYIRFDCAAAKCDELPTFWYRLGDRVFPS